MKICYWKVVSWTPRLLYHTCAWVVSPWNGTSGGCGQRKTVIWRVHSWLVRVISEEQVVSCHRSSCLACSPCPLLFFPMALLLERDSVLYGLLKYLCHASPVLVPNPWIWPLLLSSQLQCHQVKGVIPYDGPVASPVLRGFHWGPMTLLWAVPLPLFCRGATHEWLEGGAYLMS